MGRGLRKGKQCLEQQDPFVSKGGNVSEMYIFNPISKIRTECSIGEVISVNAFHLLPVDASATTLLDYHQMIINVNFV